MEQISEQLPALVGVALGAIAAYVATALNERSRWRRQQSVRWDDKRLTTYVDYANAVKKLISVAVRLASERGVAPVDEYSTNQAANGLPEAEENRTLKWEAVLMLGSDGVIQAGRRWHETAFALIRVASGMDTTTPWADAVEASSQARRQFYEAARRDIGSVPIASPERFEWQFAKVVREAATREPA
ncbi:hypothetical protein AB0J82_09720 [Asanoa sp. NPDC049518]|uniref:hypothetical protein n=1 Tax=unclassified Asanoa TaxID=2685164 RepID=UPI003445B3BA